MWDITFHFINNTFISFSLETHLRPLISSLLHFVGFFLKLFFLFLLFKSFFCYEAFRCKQTMRCTFLFAGFLFWWSQRENVINLRIPAYCFGCWWRQHCGRPERIFYSGICIYIVVKRAFTQYLWLTITCVVDRKEAQVANQQPQERHFDQSKRREFPRYLTFPLVQFTCRPMLFGITIQDWCQDLLRHMLASL